MAAGRVYQRGKVWYLDYSTGRVIDGKHERVRRRSQARNKTGAQEELNEELYKLRRATLAGGAPDNRYPLDLLYADWRESLGLTISNQVTREGYLFKIKWFMDYFAEQGIICVDELTPLRFDATLKDLSEGLSNRSLNDGLKTLRSMLKYGVSRKLIASNPLEQVKYLPDKPVKRRRALTEEECAALLSTCPAEFYPLWLFMLSTGVRKGELIELEWKAVDLKKMVVHVHPTDEWKPKTDSGIRTIPLSGKCCTALKKLPKISEIVFCTPQGRRRRNNLVRTLTAHLRNALCSLENIPYGKRLNKKEREQHGTRLAEIEEDLKRIDVHCLRYTFCTHLIKHGVDIKTVQRLMGHSSPTVTLRIYAQYSHGNAECAIDKLPWS